MGAKNKFRYRKKINWDGKGVWLRQKVALLNHYEQTDRWTIIIRIWEYTSILIYQLPRYQSSRDEIAEAVAVLALKAAFKRSEKKISSSGKFVQPRSKSKTFERRIVRLMREISERESSGLRVNLDWAIVYAQVYQILLKRHEFIFKEINERAGNARSVLWRHLGKKSAWFTVKWIFEKLKESGLKPEFLDARAMIDALRPNSKKRHQDETFILEADRPSP